MLRNFLLRRTRSAALAANEVGHHHAAGLAGRCAPRRRRPSPSAQAGVDPDPAQRLGLPAARAVARPRQGGAARCAAGDQVGQRASGQVASWRRRRRRSRPPRRVRSRGRGRPRRTSRAGRRAGRPTVRDRRVARAPGTARAGVAPQRRVHPASRSNAGLDRRAEVVRRAAPAEREPAVGGALPVDDQVPVVGERLAARSPIWSQTSLGQRLGRHHQRVDRDDRPAPRPGSVRRVALGRAHDDVGARRLPLSVGTGFAMRDSTGVYS